MNHEAIPLLHPRCSVLRATSRCQGLCLGELLRVTGQLSPSCVPTMHTESNRSGCLPPGRKATAVSPGMISQGPGSGDGLEG